MGGPPVQCVERFIDPARGSTGSGTRYSVSNLTASDKSMHFKNLKHADGARISLPPFYSNRCVAPPPGCPSLAPGVKRAVQWRRTHV